MLRTLALCFFLVGCTSHVAYDSNVLDLNVHKELFESDRSLWNIQEDDQWLMYTHVKEEASKISLNRDPINDYVKYYHENWNVNFNMPYNLNWGTEKFYVEPYNIFRERIYYGPVSHISPYGSPVRLSYIGKSDNPEPYEDVVNSLKDKIDACENYCEISSINESHFKNYSLVSYTTHGMSDSYEARLISSNDEYFFNNGFGDEVTISMIQDLIE